VGREERETDGEERRERKILSLTLERESKQKMNNFGTKTK
jgi:hypothetical protein